MRRFKIFFIFYLCITNLFVYGLAWSDLLSDPPRRLTGNILKDFYKSIVYYFCDVLIFWWVYIIGMSLFLAIVTTLIYKSYLFLKKSL